MGDLAIGAGYQFLDHRYAKTSTEYPCLADVRAVRSRLADFEMVVYAMLLHHKGIVAIPYSVVESLELGGDLDIISDDEKKVFFVRRKENDEPRNPEADIDRSVSDETWWHGGQEDRKEAEDRTSDAS